MADEVFLICWIGKFVAEGTCGSHASREYCSEKSGGDPTWAPKGVWSDESRAAAFEAVGVSVPGASQNPRGNLIFPSPLFKAKKLGLII